MKGCEGMSFADLYRAALPPSQQALKDAYQAGCVEGKVLERLDIAIWLTGIAAHNERMDDPYFKKIGLEQRIIAAAIAAGSYTETTE